MGGLVCRNIWLESVKFSGRINSFGLSIDEVRAITEQLVEKRSEIKSFDVYFADDLLRIGLEIHASGEYYTNDISALRRIFENYLETIEKRCKEYAEFKRNREIEGAVEASGSSFKEILERNGIPIL